MNPITPAATTTTTSATGSTSATAAAGNNLLDKNTFLKLMMAQLKNQDPLNPSDPSQYTSELAQLTSLEQETNIAQSAAQTAAEQNTTTALALLGHTVSYTDPTGATATGLVQKVDFTGSGPTLTVNGTSGIDPSSVNEVS
jgi:flagellar basal-body rod modification protein FlgD